MSNRNIKWITIHFLLLIAISQHSCRHDAVIPENPTISFQAKVLPIIRNNCTSSGCHDGYGNLKSMVYYTDIKEYVTPNDAHKSDIYQRITKLKGGGKMPINGHLSESQILLIYTWIMQGAQNN